MPAREDLVRLAGVLSEAECAQLLGVVQKTAVGDRFWEKDVAIFYNEYVKLWPSVGPEPWPASGAAPDAADEDLFVPIPIVKHSPGAERIALPPAQTLDASLYGVLRGRRSRREYADLALSPAALSTLLRCACGVTGSIAGYGYDKIPLRGFPSSGALQSPEVYLAVRRVDGIAPGVYHYRSLDHSLATLHEGNRTDTLHAAAFSQPCTKSAALTVILTGCYERLKWKYGERAYRYLCMEAGMVGENLYLVAEALGLGACAIAGFCDAAVEELLGIDGDDEMALLMMTVGPRAAD